jgi:7,8-dihydropterin-6-yl-methyl-4-(beta-D-ribofuranosyl)aminobenzene 5'-phosphate synthase
MSDVSFREADRLEITILIDNYTDMLMLEGTESTRRPQIPPPRALLAEHGLSCLLTVSAGPEKHTVLMDAGISSGCLFHNADFLNTDLKTIESVVLSHGHFDHFGGLYDLLKRVDKKTLLHLHPDAFLARRMNIPAIGRPVGIPPLDEDALERAGAVIQKSGSAVPLASGLIWMTGEVERTTPFEKGFPWAEAKIGDKWVVDPFRDDQAVVVKLRDKGLVILSGCAHAGIINTVEHAKKIAKTDRVHAVLGGFHLTGPLFDPIIKPTVDEMKRINPDYIVPMHCTGWKAINRFAEEMPGQFVLNTVGTTHVY